MYLHRSNSADALVGELARIVQAPVSDPTAPECIVVQGRGMERWLSAELSRRFGVWANPSFPFPRAIIDRAFKSVLGDAAPEAGVFKPGALLWSIAKLLPNHLDDAAFGLIRNYLSNDLRNDLRNEDHDSKRIELATRVADIFDRYPIYRPDMVLGWEQGKDSHWQAILWRALVASQPGSVHTATLARAFFQRITEQSGPLAHFPERLALFGISTLPPLYMRVLSALSQRIDVHLFVLSPSREYWGDIRSSRATLRSQFAQAPHECSTDSVFAQPDGNPLLASMGQLQGDFQQLLEITDDYIESHADLYRDAPAAGTTLATIQSDVLALRYRHTGNADTPPLALPATDTSISVHSCHSPMRELEVLHDHLVAMFQDDATLDPRDVVVMMPDVEQYAPLIEAVFGGESRDRPHVPYRIADRSSRASDEVVDAFSRILTVLPGRLTAPDVVDILAIDVVRERFGITADDLGPIRTWVAETGIRWGVDKAHRVSVDQPGYQHNTWRFGLDRLLLGYAMPGPQLFADVLPYDDIEGSATALLGRFIEYCDTLLACRETFQQSYSVAEWKENLRRLLGAMIAATEVNASQHHSLRQAFEDLATQASDAGFDDVVPLTSIHALLESTWLSTGSARGFMSGGVTFCQFNALRSVPFRVVCLTGMNDGAFPRSPQPMGFDLVAAAPRVGDHAPRDDDRYLFLEALLSAHDRLLITYVGQSLQNNRAMPPSVLVGELLDALDESFSVTPNSLGSTTRSRVVIRHPLQTFSPRHFSDNSDPHLFSYSKAHCDAARSLTQPRRPPRPFVAGPFPTDNDNDDKQVVTVDELARYFIGPAQVFTEQRVGLYLRDDSETIQDREPMLLGGLDGWKLGDQLLRNVLDGDTLEHALPAVRGTGAIPLGVVGAIAVSNTGNAATAIGHMATTWQDGDMLDGLTVDRVLDDTRITGSLTQLWPLAQVTAQYAKLGRRSELGLWIRHLILCWLAPHGYPDTSVAVGRSERGGEPAAIRFRPVADPEPHLRSLLRLYWIGQAAPVPFFPEAARTYARTLKDPDSEDSHLAALQAARAEFTKNWIISGEAFDPYVQQLFGTADPLAADYRPFDDVPAEYPNFAEAARTVFLPLLAHRGAV